MAFAADFGVIMAFAAAQRHDHEAGRPTLCRVLFWVLLFIGLGVVGLGVLAALTVRLWRQVRQLGREVSAASARLAAAGDELARTAPRR